MALGIENLKKVVAAVLHLANKVDLVTQDGFQPLSDIVALLPNLAEGVTLIKDGRDAWAEFEDMDAVEREELLAFVKEEFDIADDKLESVIETAFDTIDQVAVLIAEVKEALAK
jgi:hypothetical protein